MDTVLAPNPAATQPIQEAVTPVVQPDVTAVQTDPASLGVNPEQHATEPTNDGAAQPGTSAPPFDVDEYLRLKQERERLEQDLQAERGITSEVRRMLEAQQAQQAQQQLRTDIQQEILAALRGADVDESVIDAVTSATLGRITSSQQALEQQMATWRAEVEQNVQDVLWSNMRDSFAQDILTKYALDPVYLPKLREAKNDTEMVSIATSIQFATNLYKERAYSQTVQAQEQERRASGVDVIAGTTSGPTVAEPLKPGKNLDVLSALLFGATGD